MKSTQILVITLLGLLALAFFLLDYSFGSQMITNIDANGIESSEKSFGLFFPTALLFAFLCVTHFYCLRTNRIFNKSFSILYFLCTVLPVLYILYQKYINLLVMSSRFRYFSIQAPLFNFETNPLEYIIAFFILVLAQVVWVLRVVRRR